MDRSLTALAVLILCAGPAAAGPTVSIVVGPDAPKLERFAADELAALFKGLFAAAATVSVVPPPAADHLVLVGSPATNPAVAAAVGSGWPKLTEQGHLLRSVAVGGRPALVVGGGSPGATLAAADELAHHFGVRPFLHGDVPPAEPPALTLTAIDATFEPAVRVRAWQVLGGSPAGFAGWGLDEHKRLLRQLVKLKFNRVVVAAAPSGLPGGGRFPVAGDTPGRKAFRGAKEFANPEYGKDGDAHAALTRRIGDAARELGLAVGPADGLTARTVLGFLPRVPTADAAERMPAAGFLVVADVPGDLTPTAYYLGRRAFDPALTPEAAHRRLLTPVLGAMSAERVVLGFDKINEAGALVREHDPNLGVLAPEMMRSRVRAASPPPAWWADAGKLYGDAMNEMYRGIRATYHADARPVLLYYAKRCEFAVNYFAALDAARRASREEGDAAVELWEKAVEGTYNGLTALGDVARDPSDRGTIAALAEFAYRPLRAELAAADKAARGKE